VTKPALLPGNVKKPATTPDCSGNALTAVNVLATVHLGRFGNAFRFTNTGDSIDAPNAAALQPSRRIVMSRSHKRLWIVVLSAIGLGLTAGAGVATAAIPDSGGVIHGCYDRAGALRVIDTATTPGCSRRETALNWNQTGPEGPQRAAGPGGPTGATGATGPPGTNGTNGTDGVSGYQVVAATSADDSTSPKVSGAVCPAGKLPVGGGFNTSLPAIDESAGESWPFGDMNTWQVGISNVGPTTNWTVHAFAICVFAP
jgi:hypothetical protein